MNNPLLAELRQWFGAKNNKHLILKMTLDVIFFSLFFYIAALSSKNYCAEQNLIPYEFYRDYLANKSSRCDLPPIEINKTLINLTYFNNT